MKKLKCSSCGANLKIEDNNEYAICEHCGSKYKINEDLNINIKMDDNVKDVITKGAKRFSKLTLIPIIIFVIIFICIIYFAIKSNSDFNKKVDDSKKDQEKIIEQFNEEASKNNFNFSFVSAAGTKSGFFLKNILDSIINSNKVNERIITLIFNENSTINEEEIINIKHSLDDKDNYEVSVNYDNDGYVKEIKVKKID